ncbi:hypothetical protein HDU67_000344 [Dinochytrium kinnereticum]|nr:hypothetical protein HDU67_000344 [Dinochytrium kinnereticum]
MQASNTTALAASSPSPPPAPAPTPSPASSVPDSAVGSLARFWFSLGTLLVLQVLLGSLGGWKIGMEAARAEKILNEIAAGSNARVPGTRGMAMRTGWRGALASLLPQPGMELAMVAGGLLGASKGFLVSFAWASTLYTPNAVKVIGLLLCCGLGYVRAQQLGDQRSFSSMLSVAVSNRLDAGGMKKREDAGMLMMMEGADDGSSSSSSSSSGAAVSMDLSSVEMRDLRRWRMLDGFLEMASVVVVLFDTFNSTYQDIFNQ